MTVPSEQVEAVLRLLAEQATAQETIQSTRPPITATAEPEPVAAVPVPVTEPTQPTPAPETAPAQKAKRGRPKNAEEKPITAQLLCGLFMELGKAELFVSTDGIPYATCFRAGRWHTFNLAATGNCSMMLLELCRAHRGGIAGRAVVADAVASLQARAKLSNLIRPVFNRVGQNKDASRIYIDLANDQGQYVEISADGWKVIDPDYRGKAISPIRFSKGQKSLPLPLPCEGGSFQRFEARLNLPNANHFKLVVAWLLACLYPAGPFPILNLGGPPGAAKTSASRDIKSIIDPSSCEVMAMSRDPRNMAIGIYSQWVSAIDNESNITEGTSDMLCRIATGVSLVDRAFYTNHDSTGITISRPVVINGVDLHGMRPDFYRRALSVELPDIPEHQRRTQAERAAEWPEIHAQTLGRLLDAASCAIRRFKATRKALTNLPSMADFATWVTAAEPALGWENGEFLRIYQANLIVSSDRSMDDNALAAGILKLMAGRTEPLIVTAAELREQLRDSGAMDSRAIPKTPHQLSGYLNFLIAPLDRQGLVIERIPRTRESRQLVLRWKDGQTPQASANDEPKPTTIQ
jgi:hypothetical protein